jgi:hypothetical protein
MKTVTEFSGSTLKQAAAAKAKLVGEGVAAEQLPERLGAELSIVGDRLARLLEALEAAGDQVERVRLMRVFAGTDEPKGAKKIGEFHYLIDLQPSMAPAGRDRRGGGRDRGRGGGPGRGAPGGAGGGRGAPGGAGGGPGKGGPLGRDGLPREDRGPLQTAGAGWTLTRDPSAPLHDKRRGKPGGPRRGKPGDRRGPGGPRGPGAPGAEARGDRPRGPGGDRPRGPGGDRPRGPGGDRNRFRGPRPQGPRPPGALPPGVEGPLPAGVEAGAPGGPPGPAGEGARRRRRRRGRGGPFALQPSTAPGAAAALGIPSAATTGTDPNAAQPSGPPGAPGQKKRRRRRGGRGRGQGPRPPMTGAPTPGLPSTEAPAEVAQSREAAPPVEANGNLRLAEAPPPSHQDSEAPEPGNER